MLSLLAQNDKENLNSCRNEQRLSDSTNSHSPFSLRPSQFVLIAAFCLLLYAPVVSAPWISDDTRFITSNPAIKSLSHTVDFFVNPKGTTASTTGYEGIYRPLRTLSFAIDYAIWGMRPFGFHVTNIVLHIAASILVFLICRKMNFTRNASILAAFVFASHPVQVEAVTWVSSRSDGMAAVFLLLSFLMLISGRSSRNFQWRLFGAWVSFILALLSKETAIILPLLFIIYVQLFGKRKNIREEPLLEYLIFFGTAGAYFIMRMLVLGQVAQQGYWGGNLTVTVLTMARCFWIYLKLVFLPSASSCLDYVVPLAKAPFSFTTLFPFLAAAATVAASLGLVLLAPAIGFGVLWFFLALAPVSNIFPMSMLMGERFLYIPMVGICITFAALANRFEPKGKPLNLVLNICFCLLVVSLSLLTAAKNRTWRHPELLWSQSLEQYPDSYRARMGLAATLYENGQTVEAIKQYGHALRLFPNMQVLHDLGNAYRQVGDYASAVAAYKSALAFDPTSSWTYTSLAITHLLQGKTDDAIQELQNAIRLENDYWIAHYYLGLAFERKGDIGAALQELKIALSYAPERTNVRAKINEIESGVPKRASEGK